MWFSLPFKACWDIFGRGERGRVRLNPSLSHISDLSGSKPKPCNYLKNSPDSHGAFGGFPWRHLMKPARRGRDSLLAGWIDGPASVNLTFHLGLSSL